MQYTKLVLILSSSSVSGGFSLADCNTCLLMCRCPIVVLIDFSRCFLMSFSVRPVQVFRKPCLNALKRLAVAGMKSAACKYQASSGFKVYAKMIFTIFSYCCFPRGTSHIPVLLFLVLFIINFPLFWMEISFLSIVMVHPSSHRAPNDNNGAVWIFGKMWIRLICLIIPGRWCVAMCLDSTVLPYGSITFI